DGICDLDDDCPTVADPTQADLDGDGTGDACDDADAPLHVTRARIRAERSPGAANGRIVVKGDFTTAPPRDVFAGADGVGFHIRDAGALDVRVAWAAGECRVGRRRIVCRNADGSARATFATRKATPDVFRLAVTLKRLGTVAPFTPPVT